jgi:hypothetical protein
MHTLTVSKLSRHPISDSTHVSQSGDEVDARLVVSVDEVEGALDDNLVEGVVEEAVQAGGDLVQGGEGLRWEGGEAEEQGGVGWGDLQEEFGAWQV